MITFSLTDVDPTLFCRFQWSVPGQPVSFLVYRLLFALYQIGWNTVIIILWGDPRFYRPVDSKLKWPIYASNWALLFFSCYSLMALLTSILLSRKNEVSASDSIEMNDNRTDKELTDPAGETSKKVPWFLSVTWFLQVTSYSGSFFVSVAYWTIDYDPEVEQASIFTLHTHAFSSVMAIIDICLTAAPMRFGHFVYVILFSVCYFTFTYIYYVLGGYNPYGDRFLYESLVDWESSPLLTLLASVVISMLVAPCFHLLVFCLYKLRTFIHDKLNRYDTNEC